MHNNAWWMQRWRLKEHTHSSPHNFNGLGGCAQLSCNQGISWGCGLISRLNWVRICFQVHLFVLRFRLKVSKLCWPEATPPFLTSWANMAACKVERLSARQTLQWEWNHRSVMRWLWCILVVRSKAQIALTWKERSSPRAWGGRDYLGQMGACRSLPATALLSLSLTLLPSPD